MAKTELTTFTPFIYPRVTSSQFLRLYSESKLEFFIFIFVIGHAFGVTVNSPETTPKTHRSQIMTLTLFNITFDMSAIEIPHP